MDGITASHKGLAPASRLNHTEKSPIILGSRTFLVQSLNLLELGVLTAYTESEQRSETRSETRGGRHEFLA